MIVLALIYGFFLCPPAPAQTEECPPIARRLPPAGLEAPQDLRIQWESALQRLGDELGNRSHPLEADVAVLLKACEFAIQYREFYREQDFEKLQRLLDLAAHRMDALAQPQPDWLSMNGLQVRGFRSRVDDSPQPIGLVFPEDGLQPDRQYPLYVWLHGRGDTVTDLHFLCDRLDKAGQIQPEGAIVLHPFGRQCVGYKSAGETDVMEAIEFVCQQYPIDQRRIVLMGFSMGGAGVWHLAAHYGERFVAASPGAGFAETARYQQIKPEDFPPKYQQMLWGIYDVPGYVRNLFNFPFVAYSGELDKQIQAAQVMEEAFAAEGRQLPHLIGPGMGHKYDPDTLEEILRRMADAVEKGQPQDPAQIHIQTRHLRYGGRSWLRIDGMGRQYEDARLDAIQDSSGNWSITTRNVTRFIIDRSVPRSPSGNILMDGRIVQLAGNGRNLLHRRSDGNWQVMGASDALRKQPGLSGPMDDAFIDPFLVVVPTGTSPNPEVDQWVRCELALLEDRWQSLFRGKIRMKEDVAVTPEDQKNFHLVIWGTPQSNSLIRKILEHPHGPAFFDWTDRQITMGSHSFEAANHVPLMVFPNPLEPNAPNSKGHYVVFNSGPTFRPAHDRTNSLQNPYLPDWAILSLAEPPSDTRAGKVVKAGFFDNDWQIDPDLQWSE